MKATIIKVATLTTALALSACAKGKDCERDRLNLVRAFAEIQHTAADAKKLDDERAKKMDGASKKAHVERWALIENKAGLLHSAVLTKQVTWDSAANAIKEIKAEYSKQPPVSAFEQGFGPAMDQASASFEEFRGKCR